VDSAFMVEASQEKRAHSPWLAFCQTRMKRSQNSTSMKDWYPEVLFLGGVCKCLLKPSFFTVRFTYGITYWGSVCPFTILVITETAQLA